MKSQKEYRKKCQNNLALKWKAQLYLLERVAMRVWNRKKKANAQAKTICQIRMKAVKTSLEIYFKLSNAEEVLNS